MSNYTVLENEGLEIRMYLKKAMTGAKIKQLQPQISKQHMVYFTMSLII